MLVHLIAAIFAALGAAGIALLLRRLSGQRLPRWIIPVFAGLGMLGYQIHYEYSWFAHKQALLPEASEVVTSERSSAFWRPWTYIYPMTTAFTVLDRQSLEERQVQGQRTVGFVLYRFEKHFTDLVRPQAYVLNCDTHELAEVVRDEGESGSWRRLGEEDPLLQRVCKG